MIAIGVWRQFVRHVPWRYHPSYWSLVFPLGMYSVATFRMFAATDLDGLSAVPQLAFGIAFIAWLATAAGLVHEGVVALRHRAGAG